MLGHATLLIKIDGKTIITDPWLTDPLYFGQLTHSEPFRSFTELPPIDLVLVSHGHQDHFDPGTLEMIPNDTPVVIHKGYQKTAKKTGFQNVHPVQPGETYSDGDLQVFAMTGKHPGGIATFMIQGREGKVYFGGDSVFCSDLEDALRDTKPDVALMPISGGGIGPYRFHMSAKEAASLIKASGAKTAIPMHYHFQQQMAFLNRFLMQPNCLDDFCGTMAQIAPEVDVKVLSYGDSWEGS